MPAIAVVAAVGADFVAGTALATAAFSATTAFEIVAAVGATAAAIGTVTRDKTLTMAGTIIGAIGGVGGLASAAGLFGSGSVFAPAVDQAGNVAASVAEGVAPAASIADQAGNIASPADSFAEGLAPATAGTTGGPIDAGAWNPGAQADAASQGTLDFVAGPQSADQFTGAVVGENQSGPPTGLPSLTKPTDLGIPDTSNPIISAAMKSSTDTTAITPPTGPVSPQDMIAPPPYPPGGMGGVDAASGKVIPAPPDSGSGIFSKILDFTKNNQMLSYGILQAGGALLSGATSQLTPAQIAALNAQATANNAASALAEQQTRNLAMPKAVASSTPITGAPLPLIPPTISAGLINNQPRQAVTGVPA